MTKQTLTKIDAYRWKLPKTGGMHVPGIIYAQESMLADLYQDDTLKQVANVAQLPGIIKAVLGMPDLHSGYGFPIGGVAAFDWDNGIISPGAVGYDINCGVRLSATGLLAADVKPHISTLLDNLFFHIPSGVGSRSQLKLKRKDLRQLLQSGSSWAIKNGYGALHDLDAIEDEGCMTGANPDLLSEQAIKKGKEQLGTLGSGNHFFEIGKVDHIFDAKIAGDFGLAEGQLTLMLHTGSRGLGYQICNDTLKSMLKNQHKHGIDLPDRQLTCSPITSNDGQAYFQKMACGANYAWANRQVIMHIACEIMLKTLEISPRDLNMRLVYDVSHNLARKETYEIEGVKKQVCVHRKGATRALPKGHSDLKGRYRHIGQPIIIPGDMGRASYVMVGTKGAVKETFASICHGAGRLLSRKKALKKSRGRSIYNELEQAGIAVRWKGRSTLAEEMPEAYKDIHQVVETVHQTGIAKKVARLIPLGVLKG